MADPALSVIVATRDRPEDLSRCLDALALQTLGEQLEVVVVDDGSAGDIEGLVRDGATAGRPLRYVREEGVGAGAARDHGTEVATADLLAYLDDDAVPVSTWAEEMVGAFDRWGCTAAAGRIVLRLLSPAPDWMHGMDWRLLTELDLGLKPLWLRGRDLPASANCAVTRSAFISAGGFTGGGATRAANTLSSGEDTSFFRRVRHAGGSIAYVPEATAEHVIPERRLTTEWFIRRAVAQGASTALLALDGSQSRSLRLAQLMRLALRLLRLPAELARDAILRRGTMGTRLFLAYQRGALFALMKARAPAARESL